MQIYVNSSGRCAHGAFPSSCPICSGGGGGGGKIQTQTGMNWSEAAYVYNRLHNIELAKTTEKQDFQANLMQRFMQQVFSNMLTNNRFQSFMAQLQANVFTPVINIVNTIGTAFVNTATQATTIFNNVAQTLGTKVSEMVSVIIGVSDKIAAIFGERIEALKNFVENSLKEISAKLFQENVFSMLLQAVFRHQDKFGNMFRDTLTKITEKIFGIFKKPEKVEDYFSKRQKKKKKHSFFNIFE